VSRAFRIALSLGLLLTALVTVSRAHDTPHPPVLAQAPVADPAEARGPAPASLLLVVLAAVSAAGMVRRKRLALSLVLLLAVLGFEAGFHSVHHLDDPARAAECAVAVATAHLAGSLVDGVSAGPVALRALCPVVLALPAPVVLLPRAPHTGRAPPIPIG
jgi:hypothetical protein